MRVKNRLLGKDERVAHAIKLIEEGYSVGAAAKKAGTSYDSILARQDPEKYRKMMEERVQGIRTRGRPKKQEKIRNYSVQSIPDETPKEILKPKKEEEEEEKAEKLSVVIVKGSSEEVRNILKGLL